MSERATPPLGPPTTSSVTTRVVARPRTARPAMPLRPLLPQLNPSLMALRNRILAAPASRLSGGRVLVWQDHRVINPVGELCCKLGHLTVDLAAENLSALEPRLLGFESFVASEACTSLVEHALAPVLDLIEALAGRPVACEAFRRIGARAQDKATEEEATLVRIGFVLLGVDPQQPDVRGWVRAAPAFWRALDLARTPHTVPLQRHHAVPLVMSVRLGQCTLPLAELRQLVPGDALRVTPALKRQADGGLPVQVVHPGGRFGCRARLAGDQLTLETLTTPLMDTQPPSRSSAATAPNEHIAASMECELSFEIGSLRMSLAELGRLRVGQALRLGQNLQEQPVRILTSGREIARGELAAVGEELVVVVSDTHKLPNL